MVTSVVEVGTPLHQLPASFQFVLDEPSHCPIALIVRVAFWLTAGQALGALVVNVNVMVPVALATGVYVTVAGEPV